jgi:TatD DNase family protein
MKQSVIPEAEISLVDSHAHLDQPEFNQDRAAVIIRARKNSVHSILCPLDLCSKESLENGFRLQQDNEGIFLAAGVHPHQANQLTLKHLDAIRKLAAEKKILAVGETGLDFHYHFSPPEKQLEAFSCQLELASELKLPVIVHSRLASEKIIEAVHSTGFSGQGILHCFTESLELARVMIEKGFLISFSGILTYPWAENIREIARKLPLENLLVETDAPYLAPYPEKQNHRRNEPAFVASTARELARCQNTSLEKVAAVTRENFFSLFNLHYS